jgi:hypothetical protein
MKKPHLLNGTIVVPVPEKHLRDPHNRPYIDKAMKAATGMRRPYYRWKVLDTDIKSTGWQIIVEFTMQDKEGRDLVRQVCPPKPKPGPAYIAPLPPLPPDPNNGVKVVGLPFGSPEDQEATLSPLVRNGWTLVSVIPGGNNYHPRAYLQKAR